MSLCVAYVPAAAAAAQQPQQLRARHASTQLAGEARRARRNCPPACPSPSCRARGGHVCAQCDARSQVRWSHRGGYPYKQRGLCTLQMGLGRRPRQRHACSTPAAAVHCVLATMHAHCKVVWQLPCLPVLCSRHVPFPSVDLPEEMQKNEGTVQERLKTCYSSRARQGGGSRHCCLTVVPACPGFIC